MLPSQQKNTPAPTKAGCRLSCNFSAPGAPGKNWTSRSASPRTIATTVGTTRSPFCPLGRGYPAPGASRTWCGAAPLHPGCGLLAAGLGLHAPPSGEPARTQSFDRLVSRRPAARHTQRSAAAGSYSPPWRLRAYYRAARAGFGTAHPAAWRLEGAAKAALRCENQHLGWAGAFRGKLWQRHLHGLGMNGQGVMNLSHLAAQRRGEKLGLSLDFGATLGKNSTGASPRITRQT